MRVCVLGVGEERLRFCSLWVMCGVRVLCFRVLVSEGSWVGLSCVFLRIWIGVFCFCKLWLSWVGFGGFLSFFFWVVFLLQALRFLLYTAGVPRGA
jgi:hypothetical protein